MTPEALEQAWAAGRIVPLPGPLDHLELAEAIGPVGSERVLGLLQRRWGPGVLVGSGGSNGRRRWCLQPLDHLEASAAATGRWLVAQGLDPAGCLHLNPLPMHHVSGLLPLVRSRLWGCALRRLPAELMRDPRALAAAVPLPADRPALISLVPTQLQRLMTLLEGRLWLRQLALIWVGGAPLPAALAARARDLALPLSPCYGATETAAMVCALAPERFLAGVGGCGEPLDDAALEIEPSSGAIAVGSARLSPGFLEAGALRPLPAPRPGWWISGDAGRLGSDGLCVLGRLDGAIHSGGETVFPEQVTQALWELIRSHQLPVQQLLLMGEKDAHWGERLVALVRPQAGVLVAGASAEPLLAQLQALVRGLRPSQRPGRWLVCHDLEPSPTGKWNLPRWRHWLAGQADGCR